MLLLVFSADWVACSVDTKRQAAKLRTEGDTLLVSGDAAGALSKYAQAITLEPKEVKNYLKSYRANQRLKKNAACIRDLTSAIEHDVEGKEVVDSLALRANLYITLGRCEDALNDWEQVLARNPQKPGAPENRDRAFQCQDLLTRAKAQVEAEDWHAADVLYTQAIEVSRSHAPELKRMRAKARYHKGDHYECIADAGEVVKHDRNDVGILTLRGQAYFRLGDLEMAMRHAQEALQSDPDFTEAKQLHKMVSGIKKLIAKGQKSMEQQQWMDAVESYEKISQTWDTPWEIEKVLLLDICKCAGKLKDRAWVHRACGRCFERDNHWLESRIAFAEILAELSELPEEIDEVVRAWNNCLEIDRNNRHCHDGLQRAQAALKQSKSKNYYKILGVARNCKEKEIKTAYRKLAKEFHPDRHQGVGEEELRKMEKKFADIAEAYEVLSDAEKRGKYDRGEDVFENQGGGQRGHPFRHGRGGFQWGFGF